MNNIPANLQYTRDHEWLLVEGNTATVGITYHAQEQLGDIVFAELPVAGDELKAGDSLGVVESTKAVSDVYSPVDGKVIEINDAVVDSPERVNADPYGDGWLIKVEFANMPDGLMDAAAYGAYISEE
ncbi:MAG: glycine cleavage system protein GcvH [Oligoflexia bacterium]|nr:glycine cleavage system protein GcvH [Oligoflexia bacterium]